MPEPVYVIHTDGASKGNPGHAGIAYVIAGPNGETAASHARYIGEHTSNVAEYVALVEALDAARELGATRVEAFSDSQLMVNQVSGVYRVKNETLRPLYEDVIAAMRRFRSASLVHVPREKNKEADKLAGDAIRARLNALQGANATDDAGVPLAAVIPASRQPTTPAPSRATRSVADSVYAIHTDGASKGNPGHASIAYVITDADGETVAAHARYIGSQTNNVAEYTALVEALEAARELGIERVEAFSDSQLMVKQVAGEYAVRNETLRPLYEDVVAALRLFRSAALTHVPREQNKQADKLAGDAIRAHLKTLKAAEPPAPDHPS